jgi:RNA polymerase sigma factor (sigma-70 family)
MDSSTTDVSAEDATLVAASQRGDVEAFGQLIERYHNLVCAVAYARTGDRNASEDIAQDTFLAAWRDLAALRTAGKLRPWLCGIARNLAGKSLRGRRHEVDADELEGELAGDPGPLRAMLTNEREAVVWAALEQLPPAYREPLILFYREDQSIKEVARGLGLTEETAKQRLSRGRTSLKENLSELVEQTLQAGRPRKAAAAAVLAAILATRGTSTAVAATSRAPARKWLVGGGVLATLAGVAVVVGTSRSTSPSKPATDITSLRRARDAWQASGASRTCEFRGSVSQASAPIANAVVAIMEHSWQSPTLDPLLVETDAHGRWQMPPQSAGTYTVSVSAPGLRAQSRIVTCPASNDFVFELQPGGTPLRGATTDAGSGAIANVTVFVVDPHRLEHMFVTRSKSDGSYELLLEPAQYMIVATHPEYTLDARPISLATARREDFTLLPGASIEGVVVDAAGAPVPGAKLSVLVPTSPQPAMMTSVSNALLPTTADADGRFQLRGLAPGTVQLVARAGNLATSQPTAVDLSLAETRSGIKVSVDRAHKITGFVVGDGRGVAAARVIAFREDAPIAAPIATTTDGAGYFELAGLLPGKYRLAAVGASFAPYITEQPIALTADITDQLVMLEHGVALRGHADAGAAVKLEPAPSTLSLTTYARAALSRAVVDANGDFTFAAVAPGDYVITATTFTARGSLPVRATAPQTNLRVKLEPSATLSGHVTDATGKPVAGVLVAGTGPTDPVLAPYANARTDEAGAFTIVGVSGGKWRLRVFDVRGQRPWAITKRPFKAERIDVAATGTTTANLVVAHAGNRISGVVVDADRRPVADAWIDVRARDAVSAPELFRVPPTQADANGRFTIDGLFGAELIVEAAGPDRKQRALALAAPGSALELQLKAPVPFALTVTHQHRPVSTFDVKLTQPQQSPLRNPSQVLPGEYELVVTSDVGYAKQPITIATAETKTVELSAWASLRGRIVGSDGEPWRDVPVMLDETLEPALARTDANGNFAINKVIAGKNEISLLNDGEFIDVDFDLQPGQRLDLGTLQPRMMKQTTASASPDLGLQFFVSVAPPTDAQLAAVPRDPLSAYSKDPKAALWIANVEPNSVGARAGFRRGDRITAVGLSKVDNPREMMMSLSQPWRSRGRSVPWTVLRDGRELRVEVLVSED